jgi:NADP-dependent 3-hydroxy acid dehydrogenase YdfG
LIDQSKSKKRVVMSKIALITGATAGIGEATAFKLAGEGMDLIITGRREARLLQLKNKLEQLNVRVHPLCFDVRDEQAVKEALGSLPEEWQEIDILVNNAGLAAGMNALHEGDSDDWNRMIDTNVKGLLYVTRAVTPGMVARGRGQIINIGSIAGKEVYPNGNVYCATKHAVDALTKGMRIDLLPHGIRVTQICPGAVETEFSLVRFHGDAERAGKVYEGFENLVANDIAECIHFVVTRPPHVNINDMVVMPTAQATATLFHKV